MCKTSLAILEEIHVRFSSVGGEGSNKFRREVGLQNSFEIRVVLYFTRLSVEGRAFKI